MYPSRPVPASSGYYDQAHDQPEQTRYDGGAPSHGSHYSRSSSVSSVGGYQQATPQQYSNIPAQQAPPYPHSHYYEQQPPRHYSSTPGPTHQVPQHAQFQQRSSSDGVPYITDQPMPPSVRRSSLTMQAAPRERSMSLSYHQPSPTATSYNQHYNHDARYSSNNPPYPPSSYRGSVPSPATSQHPQGGPPFTRPAVARLNTDGSYHSIESHSSDSSVMTQSPSHARGEVGSANPPQPYLQPVSPMATNQARPHVCDNCGLSFVRGHDLKRHKDTHSNAKPHICDCGKSFSRKDALKRHIFLKSCRGKESMNGYATSED